MARPEGLGSLFSDETEPDVEVEAPEAVTEAEPQEQTVVEAAPTAAPEKPEPHLIPITAIMDEREKRQQAQREADEAKRQIEALRKQMADYEAEKRRQPPPDVFTDTEGRFAYEQQVFNQRLLDERLNISEMLMREKVGNEVVDAATAAFKEEATRNPALGLELARQTNPYGYVVNWHKRHKLLSDIGEDPEAYKARIIAEYIAQQQQAPQEAPASTRPRLPGSLATAPSAGRDSPVEDGPILKRLFGG